jgi:hypothetical protein
MPNEGYSDLLENAGKVLFGEMWKTQMCKLLGVNTQFMQRAMMSPPQAIITIEHRKAILKALRDRAKVATKLADRLDGRLRRDEDMFA